ncbi:MAG TPA: hypothetical protein VGP32_06360 [Steroidobacteraceae bacterium]|jgi:hypothetical protein|nr:hypothetical protein [Steroidobacteraceae bacterium]
MWRAYVRAGEAKESLLRGLQPGRMRVVAHSWPLRAKMCPCDLDLCDYLKERNFRLKSVFHLGTGGHHIVGLRNQIDGLENVILGVTVSPKEIRRYLKLVIRDPVLGQNYKVLFADVHGLHAASLPDFDLVTLFHLGAFGSTTSSGHVLSDSAVFDLFRSKLKPAGLLALYREAWVYPRLKPIVAAATASGALKHLEDYKSLQILQIPLRAASPAVRARE